MSLVSIVIPAFNQAKFVAAAVESALDQSYPWIEVVVVDDGSTDETATVLARFADRANVTVVHQANAGLPAARNRGLEETTGEFVCFLDSDDYLAPAHVERLLRPLEADAALALAYCDVQLVDAEGQPADAFSVGSARRTLSGDIFESLLIGGYFPPHAVLVRRQVLDTVGAFDTTLGGNADYELWLRLAASGQSAHYLDERLAYYRVYDGSMSRDLAGMRETRISALERISRGFPERTAAGLSAVQELTVDLHAANAWLREQWDSTIHRLEIARRTPAWSLVDRFLEAQLVKGTAEQLGLWHVPVGETTEPCVFLHPPAALESTVPVGEAGRLSAAVSIHPDVWTKPDAGGCVFTITVDQAIVGAVLLDPCRREADRRWVRIELDVPASATGTHAISIETQSVGTGYFAWALLKDVEFRTESSLR